MCNEHADQQLRAIKTRRAELRQEHKSRFARLDELQQISYTNAMARDAALVAEEDYDPELLESEYFKELYRINEKRDSVEAHKELENWVPLLAAFGAIIIAAMMLFKGLKNTPLDLFTLQNLLIMGIVGAAVWMAVFIFARSLKKKSLSNATFLLFSWMQVFTASAFAFSHGSNAVLDVLKTGEINDEAGASGSSLASGSSAAT